MSALCVSEFLKIFKTRHEYCCALLELSRMQSGLIENNDYTGLLELLQHKQRLLGRWDQISLSQPDLWEHWREQRETFPADAQADCERILADTEKILADLLDQESASTNLLSKRRDATHKQLRSVSQGARAHEAYQDTTAGRTHRHLDVDQ